MSLFTTIKNHLHTTFGCKDTVFQSKKFHILAEIGKRVGKISISKWQKIADFFNFEPKLK